jgi:hypothetical protein
MITVAQMIYKSRLETWENMVSPYYTVNTVVSKVNTPHLCWVSDQWTTHAALALLLPLPAAEDEEHPQSQGDEE